MSLHTMLHDMYDFRLKCVFNVQFRRVAEKDQGQMHVTILLQPRFM